MRLIPYEIRPLGTVERGQGVRSAPQGRSLFGVEIDCHDLLAFVFGPIRSVLFCTSAESEYVTSRQRALRRGVDDFVAGSEDDGYELRECCREAIATRQHDLIAGAVACLFVIGDENDLPILEAFAGDCQDQELTKAVKT